MTDTTRQTSRGSYGRGRRLLAPTLLLGATLLGGCGLHSWFDQSVVGRWEVTPTTAPILDRIAAIEGPDDEFVQYSEVTPDDLVPRPWEYRVGPGDFLQIIVPDLRVGGAPGDFQTVVDTRGYVYLEEVGDVNVAGLTADGIREAVSDAVLGLVTRPQVIVRILDRRQATYTMVGGIAPGSYPIPKADWFLLDALAGGGWIRESVEDIYIIRQIPLSDRRRPNLGGSETRPDGGGTQPPPTGDELIDTIDSLLEGGQGARPGAFKVAQEGSQDRPRDPAIDLIDERSDRVQPSRESQGLGEDDATWMYLDGQWVRVKQGVAPTRRQQAQQQGGGVLAGDLTTGQLVTQRIIRVPAQKLIKGDMRYNVVIEPGDIIRVPLRLDGLYFVAGFVNRPGGFSLAADLTLMRAIDQAGGVNQLGVPERIELVRMLDGDRQAIIQLNLRAINRGLEPDIYLKANDRINVGSSIWTFPLAVVRNGFRASYGFGFLLDRNFGNDVFGPPPTDNRF